ncbi:MAG: xylose isomerase [Actinobacteria bacterium 69-20]|jgi:sugar phosphate isomerase/epimerase|nr:sugar phosphate isomerase/epimerase [Actinomycetota bacterium]OJV23754.1 MAG: xylose isomerase [Actinobacteria bacterium 69-20]
MADLARLSLNQRTIDQWTLTQVVEHCGRAGVPAIGVWRDKLAEVGVDCGARLIAEAGLQVSSLCRGGFFPTTSAADRAVRADDNKRAVEEAAALRAPVLVLVCGPPVSPDLAAARRAVADGIEALLPFARDQGVRLGIEPLHPMMIGERSVIVSLREAVELAERLDDEYLGVVVDAYHVFWDPDVEALIERAGSRLVGFHASDWLTPAGDVTASRAMIGDGLIALRSMREATDRAGYRGFIEVEVINDHHRHLDGDTLLQTIIQRFQSLL